MLGFLQGNDKVCRLEIFDGGLRNRVPSHPGHERMERLAKLPSDGGSRSHMLGPAKGKDFATSIGPWLVTPDELPYADGRLNLVASASVNGRELSLCHADEQHFTWPEMVAHAARDTRLRPGDVLGSGTLTGGALIELGPLEGERFLEPGDVVTLESPALGRLENEIA